VSPPILLLIAAFLAVAILGPLWGIRQLNATSDAQIRLAAAREELDALVREQLAEETGLRGYIATGDRYFLVPDGPPSPGFDNRVDALAADLRNAGINDGGLLNDIRADHDRWEREVAAPLLAHRSGAGSLSRQTYGKVLTDQIRSAAQQLRESLRLTGDRLDATLGLRINETVGLSVAAVALFAIAAVMQGVARATALERLSREESLVAALQQTLRVGGTRLPRTAIGYAYASATREALVGGDLLDSWRGHDGRGWVLIADASGKGIEAARHSAFVQYAIRALAAETDDAGGVLERFNRLFLDTFDDPGVFVVLFLGAFDARTGTLRYASAGHSTAFVRRGIAVEQLRPTGPIIGMARDETFPTESIVLRDGDTLLLATDGLTESRTADGEMLGDEGVAALLASAPQDPQGICDLLVEEVERRSGGTIADDLAILAIRIVPREESEDAAFSTMEAAPQS
jgi:serine phosphatase RsbU (regulator of sigma subunit)